MMGSGKTSIGKILAEKINIPFYDSDQLIEDKLNIKIVDIFRNHGEDYLEIKKKKYVMISLKKRNLFWL